MYGGLGLLFFFLVLFLQQVAGFSALAAGSSSIPVTVLMFLLSSASARSPTGTGPRFFMGVGPLVAAVGMALLLWRVDADVELPDRPAARAAGVRAGAVDDRGAADRRRCWPTPTTATPGSPRGSTTRSRAWPGWWRSRPWGRWWPRRSARSSRTRSGAAALARPEVARAVEEAREAAARGGVRAGRAGGRARPRCARRPRTPRWARSAWASGSRPRWWPWAGVLGLLGITNPRRRVAAADCPGGQLVGQPREATRQSPCDWGKQVRPVALGAGAGVSGAGRSD